MEYTHTLVERNHFAYTIQLSLSFSCSAVSRAERINNEGNNKIKYSND